MNQPISTSSKKFVCLHFKTMSLLDIHTYSCIPPWMFWDLNFCLERWPGVYLLKVRNASVSKSIPESRARGTKEINDTIGLTQIGYSSAHHFFFSLSFLFFSFSLYSWQSIIICKKSSLLYNLLNQVSWDQINLSITKFYSGLKILKKLEQS